MDNCFNNISYYPYSKGKYDVSPNFHKLELNNISENPDNYVFHIDNNYSDYLENKRNCRIDNISKYYQEHKFSQEISNKVNNFIINQLCNEYPLFFVLNNGCLECRLTNEKILFDNNFQLIGNEKYKSLFDALVSQVQEDIVICNIFDNVDFLSSIHLCSPSYWSAEEKIGKNFAETHIPVAGMEKIRAIYKPILQSIITKGPFYRFAWEINADQTLNHHPDKLPLEKKFNPEKPELFVRVERQCVIGLESDTILFTIKTYYKNVNELAKTQLNSLNRALQSMSPETLQYKRIENQINDICLWLSTLENNLCN